MYVCYLENVNNLGIVYLLLITFVEKCCKTRRVANES